MKQRQAVEFDRPIYLRESGEDDSVIQFGKPPEHVKEDHENGVSRFGGLWREPDYVQTYLRASSILVAESRERNDLDNLGLPIFYLQRHTIELFLKSLLSHLYDIAKMKHEIYCTSEPQDCLPTKEQEERLAGKYKGHDLCLFWADFSSASNKLGFGDPPNELGNLIKDISAYENIHHTWSRYSSHAERKTGVLISHSKSEVAIPVVDIQNRIEKVIGGIEYKMGSDPKSYATILYDEWKSLSDRLEDLG